MSQEIRIIFMGTPEFAVPSLNMLLDNSYNVVGVITQPDKPQGRKKILMPTPVKEAAEKCGIPVLQPTRLRQPEAVAQVAKLRPDLIVTAAYGQILPKSVLDLPRFGCLNVHGSLLPRYRGGAPIQRAIINGETITGVTLMYMAEGLDTGDMISRVEVAIEPEDTSGTIFEKLSTAGAKLLHDELPKLLAGQSARTPQNEEEATYAPNLSRDDERIPWNDSAQQIYNRIRGLVPFSGAFTLWEDNVFKVWAAEQPSINNDVNSPNPPVPGTVLQLNARGIEVQTGNGTLWLTQVQPAGKKVMEAGTFARGGQMKPGVVLG